MGLKIKKVRYAHVPGHTDVCYGSDKSSILTCGNDGNVRVFNGPEDDDPSADSVAETALAVACCRDMFYVATASNYVLAFTFPKRKRDKIVFRFSAPVTHITASPSGNFVAAGSCDMEVQVLNLETNRISVFTGHKGPVLGVSLDPLDKFAVSSSCDGTVKVWDIELESLVKTFFDIIQVKNDFFKAESLCRTAWKSSSGSLLAIPKNSDVLMFKRNTWEMSFKLTSPNIEKSLSAVLFSPCGSYVAAASASGDVILWEIKHQSEVCCFKDPKKVGISGFVWHSDGSEILLSDKLGRLSVLNGINEEISNYSTPNLITNKNAPIKDDNLGQLKDVSDSNTCFDNDEDDENCISLEKIKAPYNLEQSEDNPLSPCSETSGDASKFPAATLHKPQPTFQPSSTPANFEPRCLCYNAVGIVRYYDSDKTVDVQFHDTLFHHSLFLRSFGTCTMAVLSSNVLCMAVPALKDNFSKLSCVPLNSWDGSKEWTTFMPDKENITALAAAGTWVAIATDANQIRIFTYTGIQKQVVSLPGPVVCMTGFENKLLVVCHLGQGLDQNQNEGFIIYQVSDLCVIALNTFQPLPLFPKAVLNWAGFTDEGTPCTHDSEGIIRLLGHDLVHWEVACDTRNQRKSSADHYFIVGLSEKYQNIRCILCRNSHYPLIINNPTVLEIPLKIPLCDLESCKSTHEEIFWRLMFSLRSLEKSSNRSGLEEEIKNFEQTLKQTVLKLFAEACRNSEDMRAVDVATIMSSHPLEVAIKYSSKVGKTYLAEKLSNLRPVTWKSQQDVDSQSQDNDRPERNANKMLDKSVCSQMDLFEDSTTNTEKENLSSPKTKKLPEKEMKPSEESSPAAGNPFKKMTAKKNTDVKGLQRFDELMQKKPSEIEQSVIKKLRIKLRPVTVNVEKLSSNKIKKPTFVQWFSNQKSSLAEEYPNMSNSELTKLGMKMYKETISGKKNEGKHDDVIQVKDQGHQSSKRSLKADEDEGIEQQPKKQKRSEKRP